MTWSKEDVLALCIGQKQTQRLTNLMVGPLLASANINEAEKWMCLAEGTTKGDQLSGVYYHVARRKLCS